MMKYLELLEIRSGGWLLLSMLYFFLDADLLLVVLLCAAIHEFGHLFMLDRFGVRIRSITMGITGFTIVYQNLFLCRFQEMLVAFAGPAIGLLAAVFCSFWGNLLQNEMLLLLAGSNAALSIFNLLPAKPLDGWRMLYALFPVAAQVISVCTAFCVLIAGVFLMYAGYGTIFAMMGIILILQEAPRKRFGTYHSY